MYIKHVTNNILSDHIYSTFNVLSCHFLSLFSFSPFLALTCFSLCFSLSVIGLCGFLGSLSVRLSPNPICFGDSLLAFVPYCFTCFSFLLWFCSLPLFWILFWSLLCFPCLDFVSGKLPLASCVVHSGPLSLISGGEMELHETLTLSSQMF